MHWRFIPLVAMVVCARPVFAGDSVISLDDTRAYLISGTLPQLMEIELQKKTYSAIDLGGSFKEPVVAVALSNAGSVLCATKRAVWAYDPKKAKCVKVCDGPKAYDESLDGYKSQDIQDISYDPRTKTILVVCPAEKKKDAYFATSLCYRLPKENRWHNMGDRYDTQLRMPTFSADGALFCVSGGDLWGGFLSWSPQDNSEDKTEPAKKAFFEGYRCLPLTITPVGDFNSSWVGFHRIAVTKHAIYGDYSRMGGGGIAAVIRVKRPASLTLSVKKDKDGEEDAHIGNDSGDSPEARAAFWQELQTMLNSVEELAKPERYRDCVEKECNSLCASRDGRLVLYTYQDDLSEVYLVTDDKKPETVKLKALTQ